MSFPHLLKHPNTTYEGKIILRRKPQKVPGSRLRGPVNYWQGQASAAAGGFPGQGPDLLMNFQKKLLVWSQICTFLLPVRAGVPHVRVSAPVALVGCGLPSTPSSPLMHRAFPQHPE